MLKKKSEKVFYPHLMQSRKLPVDFFPKARKDSGRGHHSQPPCPNSLTRSPSPLLDSMLFTFRRRSGSHNKLPTGVQGAGEGKGEAGKQQLAVGLVRLPPLRHKKSK
jgi:hypothetical protein